MENILMNNAVAASAQKKNNELLLIIGMHRSGTSAVSRLLNRLGFYFGKNLIGKMSGVNNAGFWEDQVVVDLNERMLQQLGSSWYSFQKLPEKWWQSPDVQDCLAAIDGWYNTVCVDEADFRHKNTGYSSIEEAEYALPIAVKDPRLCRLYPLWNQYCIQKALSPKIILVFRNPQSVALSLQQRDKLNRRASYLLWLVYMVEAMESISANSTPYALICYDRLIDHPVMTMRHILEHNFKHLLRLKQKGLNRIIHAIIRPTENHHKIHFHSRPKQPQSYEALAFSLYDDLNHPIIDLQALAVTYRAGLDALLNQDEQLLADFQAQIDTHVALSKKLSDIGQMHRSALDEIAKKDKLINRINSDLDKKISGNKLYIRKCHARIRDQDLLLKSLGSKAASAENLTRAVADREQKINQNVDYIKKCEQRISEQDKIIAQLKKWPLLWPILYAVKKSVAWFASKVGIRRIKVHS